MDPVEVLKILECNFFEWIENKYTYQTKHGVICEYRNAGLVSSR